MTKRGLSNVVLVTERFVALAKMVISGSAVRNQRSVIIPGNPEFDDPATLPAIAERALDEVVAQIAPALCRQSVAANPA